MVVLKFTDPLISNIRTRDMASQLRRSATSAAQNYAACTIAKSRRDFISKLRLALEEADETWRWLRLLRDSSIEQSDELTRIIQEARELTAILGASCATAEKNSGQRALK